MEHCTYAHYKPDGTMFYIGKGSIKRAYSSQGRNVVWNRTVKKYGGFEAKILVQWENEEDAFSHEILLIDCLKELGVPLVNIARGGLGSKGFRHTAEHKAKMSEIMKANNPMSDPATRERQREALFFAMGRPEIREKQSKARLGMKLSESHVESLRNCHPTKPCVINGVTYKSLMEASRVVGIRHGTIHRWINQPEIKRGPKYSYITECRWAD
jgi:hypothetical protein